MTYLFIPCPACEAGPPWSMVESSSLSVVYHAGRLPHEGRISVYLIAAPLSSALPQTYVMKNIQKAILMYIDRF